ncbi:hypothetical protein BVX94_03240 [bacterium B17]|nr:hypothetical protein BVX94_03240 [bacterium B17]
MNTAKIIDMVPEPCAFVEGQEKILESYAAYLSDESRSVGEAVERIYFPENTAQVVDAVKKSIEDKRQIIVSGARTGITGGAIGVKDSVLISLEKMTAQLGAHRFQSGRKLEDIPEVAGEYYPVDPTETTASLGGTVATDASGARTYYYGSTRQFVSGITVVLANGCVLEINRGEIVSADGAFVLKGADGEIRIPVTDINIPPVKNTAGLYIKKDMDLVDLFVGCEGILGIVTEVDVRLVRKPEDSLYLVIFVKSENQALGLVSRVKEVSELPCLAIEYFGPNAVNLVRDKEAAPNLPKDALCAVYLEIEKWDDDAEKALNDTLYLCNLDIDDTWAGFDVSDLEQMKAFRHSIPETVNTIIGSRKNEIPELHKIGTDTAVPNGNLPEYLSDARSAIEGKGIEYVVFGHIGNNHLHINMLPSSMEELEMAKELYVALAEKAVNMGGSVSAEHGIGRIKRHFLEIQFSEAELSAMRAVKEALDPDSRLNPGVLI